MRSDPVFERNFGKWIGVGTIAVFWGGLGGSSEGFRKGILNSNSLGEVERRVSKRGAGMLRTDYY